MVKALLLCLSLTASLAVGTDFVDKQPICEAGEEGSHDSSNDFCGDNLPSRTSSEHTIHSLEEEQCIDKDEKCAVLAENGDCIHNPSFMLTNCRESCSACVGHNTENKTAISSCYGVPQALVDDGYWRAQVLERIQQVDNYMFQQVFIEEKYRRLKHEVSAYPLRLAPKGGFGDSLKLN